VCQTIDPSVTVSLGHNDGRWAYHPYGALGNLNAGTGMGGWAMAAVDLARVWAALRPSNAGKLLLTPETLERMLKAPFGPLDIPDPEEKVTNGGWDWKWVLDGSDGSMFDLVVGKGGIIAGGACVVLIWNPDGPERESVTISICVNVQAGGFSYANLPTFQAYLNKITANGAWPEDDLFSEVVDEQP
jgi:hypothetical protein